MSKIPMSKKQGTFKQDRSQALKAVKRRSSWVKALRRIVPILVVLIILTVLLWTSIDIFFEEKIEGVKELSTQIEYQNKVVNPELHVTDDQERPIKIQAESATHDQEDEAHFEKPCCEIKSNDGQKAKLTADQGLLDRVKNIFTYRGNVVLDIPTADDKHVTLKTKSAKVLLDSRSVEGEEEIVAEGPMGTLTSKNGFRFERNEQKLILKGPSILKLNINSQDSQKEKEKELSK